MSKANVFNELGAAEYGVWCNVAAGTDPVQWASVCRWLGHLPTAEFEDVLRRLRRHRLRAGARRLANAIMGSAETTDELRPVISVGPSGLGGQYQKELKARSLGLRGRWRKSDGGGVGSLDVQA